MTRGRYIERSPRQHNGLDFSAFKRMAWTGMTAEYVGISPPADYDFSLSQSSSCLILHDLRRTDGETTLALRRSSSRDLRNKLTFVPEGCSLTGWVKTNSAASILAVYLDTEPATEKSCGLAALDPRLEFEDTMLRSTMLQLESVLHDPDLDVPGYAETLGTMIRFELGRASVQAEKPPRIQGGLTKRQARLIMDYVEGHLDHKITVSQMSDMVELSRFHFIRAFKQTVGTPPHQFVLHRRVERAKELLRDPRRSVSDVATNTGFATATQLTRTFRRVTGMTPTELRRGGRDRLR